MELLKSPNSLQDNIINKFSLKCDEDKNKWLNLIEFLYKSSNNNVLIIKGLYDKKKDIVLKIGFQEAINKEYDISNILKDCPNFIRYYCKFLCNDDIINIIKNEKMLINYKICGNGDKPIGILTMNYYNLGSVGNYVWNAENFLILKNVLKQSVYAILYAFEKKGFIHGDLHINNILLKPSNNNVINYGNIKLKIHDFEARIMDFEKSKIDIDSDYKNVIDNIQKLFNGLCDSELFNIKINYNNNTIRKLKNEAIINNIKYNSVTEKDYKIFEKMINNFYIEYYK